MQRLWITLMSSLLVATSVQAQDAKPEWRPLWPDGAPGSMGKTPADIPSVAFYPAPANNKTGAAVVVCPGGGYGGLAMDHEGYQIAAWLNSHGIAAVIVRYRHAPKYQHPTPMNDAQRALRYVRHNAADWNIDPARVGLLGFSAGGHLTSTVGTHFDLGSKDAKDPIDVRSCRPDFIVLLYPVITLKGPYAHNGSRINLLGKNASADLIDSLCNETQVTKNTPPAFLAHTQEDKAVPPENSLLFYTALTKAGVPAELHIFEKGRHGLGLGTREYTFSAWPDRCISWLQNRGFLPPKN